MEIRVHDLAMAAVLGVGEDGGRPTVWSNCGCNVHGTSPRMEFHCGHR